MKKQFFCIRSLAFSLLAGGILPFSLPARSQPAHRIEISRTQSDRQESLFRMGTAASPSGATLQFDPKGVWYNGQLTLPVMGEFHYARFPDSEWRRELLKMRAGGITIVASYIFWIHHEEEEGVYDWSGRRNLRKFVELCRELEFPIVLRVGPWCHGEVRNGGLPDWLVRSGVKLRENNPAYLEKLQTWYAAIFGQMQGMMWKDGGPVIGVQIENEYRGRGEHLMTLKGMLQEIGFDVPLYTRTGWPKLSTPVPYGEILPLYGDYADGFWDRSLAEMPGDYGKCYLFRSFRNSTVIATEQLPPQSASDHPEDTGYPYFTCELGGGMMTSYHRRIRIEPMDVYAMALVRVGSGSNLPGYYMYHGGTNPEGKLTTLNEQQASDFTYHNDLPVKSYDFQAPLGEFGQINPHYHLLRRLHLFLHDFGSGLAQMPPFFPEGMPADFQNDSTLRWAVRSNGESGYVFVNNYQRLRNSSPKQDVQFAVKLPDEELVFPEKPVTVPSGASFFFPFNLDLGSLRMVYSTAQPLATLDEEENLTVVFVQIPGIPAEFAFDAGGVKTEQSAVAPSVKNGRLCFGNVKTGTDAAIRLRTPDGKLLTLVLLDEATSLTCWKGKFDFKERLFLTGSGLTYHRHNLELDEEVQKESAVSIYPAPESLYHHRELLTGTTDGIFTRYTVPASSARLVQAGITLQKEAGLPLRKIENGKAKIAEMPKDADFEQAAVWKINLSGTPDPAHRLFLRFPYQGDVARFYSGGALFTDNFYNGKAFEVGLHNLPKGDAQGEMVVKILPLQKGAPIYLPQAEWPEFKGSEYSLGLPAIEVIERRKIVLGTSSD